MAEPNALPRAAMNGRTHRGCICHFVLGWSTPCPSPAGGGCHGLQIVSHGSLSEPTAEELAASSTRLQSVSKDPKALRALQCLAEVCMLLGGVCSEASLPTLSSRGTQATRAVTEIASSMYDPAADPADARNATEPALSSSRARSASW